MWIAKEAEGTGKKKENVVPLSQILLEALGGNGKKRNRSIVRQIRQRDISHASRRGFMKKFKLREAQRD